MSIGLRKSASFNPPEVALRIRVISDLCVGEKPSHYTLLLESFQGLPPFCNAPGRHHFQEPLLAKAAAVE